MRYHIWEGLDGQWYWAAIHVNGEIVADGAEGYATRSNARRAVRRFVWAHRLPVRVVVERG